MKKLAFLLLALMLVGCKVGKPDGIIDEATMEEILYQYHLAQSAGLMGDSSSIKSRAYVLACFKDNGVTEAEFDSSMVWYCQHMELLQKIYQRIDERYRNELASLGEATNDVNRYSALSSTGDTANVWNAHSFYLLSSNGLNNHMAFEIKADTSYKAGDSYMLNFRAEFLQQEGQRHGIAALAVQYDNDSVAHTERHFYGSGDNSIYLPPVSRRAKRIYGYIYMDSEWNINPRLLFIFQPSLVRMRTVTQPETDDETNSSLTPDSLKKDTLHRPAHDTLKGYGPHSGTTEKSLTPEAMHSRPIPRKITK